MTGTNIDTLLTKINNLEEEITLCKIEIAELKSSNLVNNSVIIVKAISRNSGVEEIADGAF